jgi:hypothetical protein
MSSEFDLNHVGETEEVSHFIWTDKVRRCVDSDGQSVLPRAFMPRVNKITGRFEFSTFRTVGLRQDAIADLGRQVAALAAKSLRGDVVVRVGTLIECKLELDPDNTPIERHLNVLGWPGEKQDQQAIAIDLAESATYRVLTP